jgi:hypothetical protein
MIIRYATNKEDDHVPQKGRFALSVYLPVTIHWTYPPFMGGGGGHLYSAKATGTHYGTKTPSASLCEAACSEKLQG